MKQQRGFLMIALAVVAVLVATAIGGYYYWSNHHDASTETTQDTSVNASETKDTTPAAYQDSQDVDSANTELDNTDVDTDLDASLKDLDNDTSDF